jgi:hypothetical protein
VSDIDTLRLSLIADRKDVMIEIEGFFNIYLMVQRGYVALGELGCFLY